MHTLTEQTHFPLIVRLAHNSALDSGNAYFPFSHEDSGNVYFPFSHEDSGNVYFPFSHEDSD